MGPCGEDKVTIPVRATLVTATTTTTQATENKTPHIHTTTDNIVERMDTVDIPATETEVEPTIQQRGTGEPQSVTPPPNNKET
jgi:hypothetical protein